MTTKTSVALSSWRTIGRTDVQRVALDCHVSPMHTASMRQQLPTQTPVSTTTPRRRAVYVPHTPPPIPANAPVLPIYLSLEEASNAARVSIWTIRSWIRKGSLPAVKPGRRVMVDRDVLLAVLANPRPRTDREAAAMAAQHAAPIAPLPAPTKPRVRKVRKESV